MSGGEQQMLTVARTLMGNPLLVLLDEPSEGVAPVIVEQMANTIVELKKEGPVDPAVRAEHPFRRTRLAIASMCWKKARFSWHGTMAELAERRRRAAQPPVGVTMLDCAKAKPLATVRRRIARYRARRADRLPAAGRDAAAYLDLYVADDRGADADAIRRARQAVRGRPCSQNHLGRLIYLDAATIKGVVDRLSCAASSLPARIANDRRRRAIALTDAGRAVADAAVKVARQITHANVDAAHRRRAEGRHSPAAEAGLTSLVSGRRA